MKYWLTGLFILLIVSLACIYLLIPAKITFSKVTIIKTKINVANRFLMDESKWGKWFPSDLFNASADSSGKNNYNYKHYSYAIERKMMNAAEISISGNEELLKSLITMFSLNSDSTAIEWKSEMPESSNPFKKVRNYLKAKELQNYMADILKHFQTFLANQENVYGINLHVIMSKDSTLVVTKCVTKSYPSTPVVYNLISNLTSYITGKGAKENNFPMLNVKKLSDSSFETMVAIPVNKYLEDSSKIFFRRFVPWKVLTAEVKGGTYTVNEALKQMKLYIADYENDAMALPFASLVTDRMAEPDTSKWVTLICTPVR